MIGNVSFALGAHQAAVMKEDRARGLSVGNVPGEETYTFGDSPSRNFSYIGMVSFKNGKLVMVKRSWGSFYNVNSPLDIIKAIHAVIERSMHKAGDKPTISVETNRHPDGEFRSIYLKWPRRTISIVTTDGAPSFGG